MCVECLIGKQCHGADIQERESGERGRERVGGREGVYAEETVRGGHMRTHIYEDTYIYADQGTAARCAQ